MATATATTATKTLSGVLTAEPGDARLRRLESDAARVFAGARRVGVAFSGGVDSTVLLAVAARALGPSHVVAVTGVSASLAARELTGARELAASLGVELVEIATGEMDRPAYRRNGLDRCFHCKDTLFQTVDDTLLTRYRLDAVAYGETADDVARGDRPGSAAAARHGVLRPLADAGFRKADVRGLAAALGLPNALKPAAPCLASRIPHGSEVTADKLRQVETAEAALHDLGFTAVRVRHHGTVARVEVPESRFADLMACRDEVLEAVRAAGFPLVCLDLTGLRSGGLYQIAASPGAAPAGIPSGDHTLAGPAARGTGKKE
ncbi:ATP-dependent sacrificial sulfur transferase LarE [Streptomyces sp. NPDC047028]|uniref:ATP-dependent sacrificial sulfur transferase LarE n=1 Tax=Streptomyces sp. NPDC047028 TaxID=3155793 RepID=UPI0034034729